MKYREPPKKYRHISLLRENYRHILQYRERPKSVPPYFITARKLPPYFAVPETAEIGTAIFHYCEKITAIFRSTGNRQKKYRQVEIPHRMCPPKKMVPRSTLENTQLCFVLTNARNLIIHFGPLLFQSERQVCSSQI